MRIFVPQDAAALALGADRIAAAIAAQAAARGIDVTLVRNGSRGLFWLEPLVEIETADGPRRLRPAHPRRRAGAVRRHHGASEISRPRGRDPVPEDSSSA